MKILFVVQRLPPDRDPEAICTAKLINALSANGVDVSVVSGTRNAEVDAGDIHCVPFSSAESMRERLTRLAHRYPETGWSWAKRMAKQVTQVAHDRQVDVVYSRAMPFVAHLAVMFADLPSNATWVAHFSDPWPADDFWQDHSGRRLRWHRRIVNAAQAVSFPCERVAKYAMKHQWGSAKPSENRCLIVPHVSQLRATLPVPIETTDPITFLHCGNFHGTRRPTTLLTGWANWLKKSPALRTQVRLHQVGAVSEEFDSLSRDLGIDDTVFQLGPVSYEASLEHMQRAHFLLLVENANSAEGIYLPSKLIDYLASDRPILALSSADSTVADLLGADYPYRAEPASAAAVTSCLERLARTQFHADDKACQRLCQLAQRFTPAAVTNKLLSDLATLSCNSPEPVYGAKSNT